jgi:hypothetical protein
MVGIALAAPTPAIRATASAPRVVFIGFIPSFWFVLPAQGWEGSPPVWGITGAQIE